jgi:hypothetical protein
MGNAADAARGASKCLDTGSVLWFWLGTSKQDPPPDKGRIKNEATGNAVDATRGAYKCFFI